MAKSHVLSETGDVAFTADADLTTKQYHFVEAASTAGNVKIATGASNPTPLGVLQNSPSAGNEARVRLFGPSKVVAENGTCNLTFGKFGFSASDGQFETVTVSSSPFNARYIGANHTAAGSIFGEVFLYGGLAASGLTQS